MQTEIYGIVMTVMATADIVKKRFIAHDGSYADATDNAVGVLAIDTSNGQPAGVIVSGAVMVESGGVVTAGVQVTSDATGRVVNATSAEATTAEGAGEAVEITGVTLSGGMLPQKLKGIALDSASAEGQFVRVLLK